MNGAPDISDTLSDALETLGCDGALCALHAGGEISTHSAGSVSAEEHDRPFYIYSVSKTFTAAAVLQLCEREGDFLDTVVSRFLPDKRLSSLLTVRHLLNHTGGLSDYSSSDEYRQAVCAHPEAPWNYERIMDVGLRNTPLFEPGSGWAYSNPGYAFLKELIELISGEDYDAFLDEAIVKPLGLSDTRPFLMPDADDQLLPGSDPSIDGDVRKRYSPGWIAPGCLISTVRDVVRFYHALFSGDLLNANSLQCMTTTVDVPVPAPPPRVYAYGLGVMHTRNDPLGAAYGHGGGGPGYTTCARHYPDLCGTAFSLCLVLNKTLPETPFDLADRVVLRCIEE